MVHNNDDKIKITWILLVVVWIWVQSNCLLCELAIFNEIYKSMYSKCLNKMPKRDRLICCIYCDWYCVLILFSSVQFALLTFFRLFLSSHQNSINLIYKNTYWILSSPVHFEHDACKNQLQQQKKLFIRYEINMEASNVHKHTHVFNVLQYFISSL